MANEKLTEPVPSWKLYNRPWYLKLVYSIGGYFKSVGILLWSVIKAIPFKIWHFIRAIGLGIKGLWCRFWRGDWRTKVSYLIMGFGSFSRGPSQFIKGLLWLLVEAFFVVFMIFLGAPNLAKFGTLGTTTEHMDVNTGEMTVGDHSLKILIFSVMTLMVMVFFLYMYIKYTKVAYEECRRAREGKPLPSVKQQLNFALNDGYNVTILCLPILGIMVITVLPLLCNILIAFTNYDYSHFPPADLFTWVGFDAFADVFSQTYGTIIWRVLGWTLVWAVFATFTNFFFGMFLAMMINKKSIKLKPLWRICFMIVIAVPDFVSLLMMSRFFGYSADVTTTGPFNLILQMFGIEGANIDWLSQATEHQMEYMLPRIMVIVINLWRGMPFTMLATSGILMNIPEDLYESSRIDGAGPVRRFISITFPYIMFVMGPQLITTFTGNINNFNVIFFLTGGGPNFLEPIGVEVGRTDLLVTWLYRMSIGNANKQYNLGAVVGIFTFLITSFFALIVFNSSKSIKQEDTFQ